MNKEVKRYYCYIISSIIILCLFLISIFLPFETFLHDMSTYTLLSIFLLPLYLGGLEGICVIVVSILLLSIYKIKMGFLLYKIGVILTTINLLYLGITNLIGKNLAYYQFGLGYILWVITSILFLVVYILIHKDNKNPNFHKNISDYKKEKERRQIERKMKKINIFFDKSLWNSLNSRKKKVNKEEYKNLIYNERKKIEELFNSSNYIEIVSIFKKIYTISKFFRFKEIQEWLNDRTTAFNYVSIKNTILDLGTKFDRLKLKEIVERSLFQDDFLIEKIINDMIINKEIHAQYFKTSKTLVFDRDSNMKEIDELITTFSKWEKSIENKKI